MSKNTDNCDLSLLTPILDEFAGEKENLITILQKAQDIYGFLPKEAIYKIAKATGNSPAKVMGVATFYTQFRLCPAGKYIISLCKGTACHVNGANDIEKAICENLGIKDSETTSDGLFTIKTVACLGCCSLSPVMMINGDAYGSLTPQKAVEIIEQIKENEKK